MKVTLLGGRLLTERDTSSAPKVVVINQSMVQKLWPNQSPVGKHIKIHSDDWQEVVGVIADVRGGGVAKPAGEQVYLPVEQNQGRSRNPTMDDLTMVLRTRVDPLQLAEAAKRVVHEIDPGQVVSNVTPVEALAAQSVAGQHTATVLIGALGVLALVLASVGVYGVMAYAVSRREHEFGIRLALGAQRHQIFAMLLGSTARIVGLGILMGTLLGIPLNGWMRSLAGKTPQIQPITFAGTALLLAAVAFLATMIPARRASRVEPLQALRTE
jgi:putative ABC transport system permease protein